jgi:methionine synthase II (cobalamin-independent)
MMRRRSSKRLFVAGKTVSAVFLISPDSGMRTWKRDVASQDSNAIMLTRRPFTASDNRLTGARALGTALQMAA